MPRALRLRPAQLHVSTRAAAVLLFLFSMGLTRPETAAGQVPWREGRTAAPADSERVFTILGEQPGADSLVTLIVEFVEPPLYLGETRGFAAAAQYEERFEQLASDLRGAAAGLAAASAEVLEGYHRVFFGALVRVPKSAAAGVAALPYVRRVTPDAEVRAFLGDSVSRTHSGPLRPQFDGRGEGVTVGIIDSGVDYTHPALGGGFGPGFKVVGGYDFVNEDGDPMDDAGHGTHVAGIVAADGEEMQGVAPGVRLFAFKVLNERGRGQTSDIIKAVERSVDPNGDGDLSDRLDVVNVSLGSDEGTPDDPASVAVDNAVRLGVTFVIAAGNAGDPLPVEGKSHLYDYNGSETVGSPGTSRLAVTVGAVDGAGAMAPFSSKGPSSLTFAVKPDVVAPGVAIRSTWPGGGFETKNGTSMASPYVAGAAALLKALHPSWKPAQIKAALANSAVDQGHLVMHQGAGRVDTARAANVQTLVLPSNFSYGMDDASAAVWEKPEEIWVHNESPDAQQYTVSFTGERGGISLRAAPSSFSIPAGDSVRVTVTLTVDNRAIPTVAEDIKVYGGAVRVTGTRDAMALPWSFSRTSVLRLAFSEPGARILGVSEDAYFTGSFYGRYNRVRWTSPTTMEVYGTGGGTYDVAAVFESPESPARMVIREEIPIGAGGGSISLDAADAVHPVYFDGVDEAGGLLRTKPGAQQLLFADLPVGRMAAMVHGADSPSLLVSPASPRVRFTPMQVVAGAASGAPIYVPQFAAVSGMAGELRISNSPGAYLHQHLHYRLPPETDRVKLYSEFGAASRESDDGFTGFLGSIDVLDVSGEQLETELYLMAPLDPSYTAPSFGLNFTDLEDRSDLTTPYFTVDAGRIVAGLPSHLTPTHYRSASGDTMTFGGSPVLARYIGHNGIAGPNSIHFRVLMRGALREDRYGDYPGGRYAIFDEQGGLVKEASLFEPRDPLTVNSGRYRLEVETSDYRVGGKEGRVHLVSRFDLSQVVRNAPSILSLQILDGAGKQTDGLGKGDAARLVFSSQVEGFDQPLPVSDAARVWFRVHGTADWQLLPVEKVADLSEREGVIFQADLRPAAQLDSVAVDLRVAVEGAHDNTAELTLEPAFTVGPWRVRTGDGGSGEQTSAKPALYPNFPNPFRGGTHVTFSLPAPQEVKLSVYDVLGREVATLLESRGAAGENKIFWNAEGLPSGVYFLRLTAGGQTLTRKMAVVR